jgi:hypothetical protein
MSEVTPIRPELPVHEEKAASSVDRWSIASTWSNASTDERDRRDVLVLGAICAAIRLIDCDEEDLAGDVLRLARDRLEAPAVPS